jgi:hypothetical protein
VSDDFGVRVNSKVGKLASAGAASDPLPNDRTESAADQPETVGTSKPLPRGAGSAPDLGPGRLTSIESSRADAAGTAYNKAEFLAPRKGDPRGDCAAEPFVTRLPGVVCQAEEPSNIPAPNGTVEERSREIGATESALEESAGEERL